MVCFGPSLSNPPPPSHKRLRHVSNFERLKGVVRWSCGRFSDSLFFAKLTLLIPKAEEVVLPDPGRGTEHQEFPVAEVADAGEFSLSAPPAAHRHAAPE